MKSIVFGILLFCSNALANNLDGLVEDIRKGNLTISDIALLSELDNSNQQIGYGLCVAAGGSPTVACDKNGTVGYGLCVIAGKSPTVACDKNATVGYGLCVLAGGSPTTGCSNIPAHTPDRKKIAMLTRAQKSLGSESKPAV